MPAHDKVKQHATAPRSLLRRRIVLIASVVVLLAVGPYAVSRLRSPGRRIRIRELPVAAVAPTHSHSLRVLSYNIAHGRGPIDDNWQEAGDPKQKRISKIAQLLVESKADVVVLNEVDFDSTWSGHQNQAEALAQEAGFPFYIEERNYDFRFLYGSWKFGNAILSRFPIVAARVIDLPPHAQWEDWLAGRKRGVVCTLQLPENRLLRLAAVHLEHRRESNRVLGAQMLVELARTSEIPLIAAGDFNSTLPGFPKANVTADGQNAMEILRDSGLFRLRPTEIPERMELTYSSSELEQVIDWILIPVDWEFENYSVFKTELSDHRPVFATVKIGDPDPSR